MIGIANLHNSVLIKKKILNNGTVFKIMLFPTGADSKFITTVNNI